MDTVELIGNGFYSNDMYMEHSMPPVESLECDSSGEQDTFPRIGEDYQAEIPELVKKSEYLSHENYPPEVNSFSLRLLMGPIPMTLVQQDSGHLSQETAENFEMLQNVTNVKEPACSSVLNGIVSGESSGVAYGNTSPQCEGQGYLLVPGLASQCWSDVEKESFLLGLYIFGKNLVQLKKFVGSKRMGDIQAYYYGKFYRMQEYLRWSDRRKIRSRKCVVGQKLFTGVRQQEFLSRILPILSDECKHALLEVSKIFEEGKMPFEEFVFSLKKLVGMNILVEAVGIGKGKNDLTNMALEPTRSNLGISKRPEIPVGKACSSLTCKEIVKYLTGDYRLSKARSNDLFWEAVLPRLLARGWHSEKSTYAAGSKNTLVFLVPGTENFSRYNLQRGYHYFDSVSDVLNKVASEPRLIELEHEEDESKKNEEEIEWKNEKSEEDDGPTHSRHCYLQPRTPTRDTDGMRFTVVDTSLGDGRPYNIREWTSLSADIFHGVNFRNSIDFFYQDAPDASTDESDPDNIKYPGKDGNFNGEVGYDLENAENTEHDMHEACLNPEIIPADDNTVSKHCPDYKKPKRVAKDNSENDAPVIKRRRKLTPCNRGETSKVVTGTSVVAVTEGLEIPINILQNPSEIPVKPVPCMAPCGSVIHDFVERLPSSDVSDHEKLSLTSSSKSSSTGSAGCSSIGNLHAISQPQEAPRVQNRIDLNLPPDFDTGCSVTEETQDHNEKTDVLGYNDAYKRRSTRNRPPTTKALESLANGFLTVKSTRNRPPTTKALEALANGFLSVKSRRKDKEGSSRDNSTFRPSRRAQGEIEPSEYRNNDVAPGVQESQSDGSGVNASEIREFQAIP